jgi:hypothetical protein
MITSRKSDQRPLLNLTIKEFIYQGALFNIHNFENVLESLRINYFAQITCSHDTCDNITAQVTIEKITAQFHNPLYVKNIW